MGDGSRLPWIIAISFVFMAAFFAVTETAAASASRTKIKVAADRGDKRAINAMYALEHFDQAISTLLICTNITHLATATIVTVQVTRLWGLAYVTVSTVVTTLVMFFAGEMLPKSIAKKNSEALLLACAGTLCFLMKVFSPVSALLTAIGQAAARLTKGDMPVSVTEEELYDLIEDMTEDGTLDESQSDLISSALQFGSVTVESILTPRVDMAAVDISMDSKKVLAFVKAQKHSRLPVYEGTIDNIIGILQIRKFIKTWLHQGENFTMRDLLDDAVFVHQSTYIDDLLPVMSRKKQNIAIVTDNYGGTLGLVTMEDMLEELVGEIWDEDDVVNDTITELGEGLFQIDGDESVSDAFEEIGFEAPESEEDFVNTLMGEWAYEQFGVIPKAGDQFRYHGLCVTVSEMQNHRIKKLTISYLPEKQTGGAQQ